MSCQQCCGITRQFNDKSGQRQLKRYRRHGPDQSTRMLIEQLRSAIQATGGTGLTLLDIGAGVGAIHHEMLNGIVSRATHVDASPSQLAAAREETERHGHTNVVDFIEGDFTSMASQVSVADIVTLDRVICCFDDMKQLVRLSASKSGQFLGAVYPRDVPWIRVFTVVFNFVQRVRRNPFRVFLHDPGAIDAELRVAGLQRVSERHTINWHVVVYRR